MAEVGVLVRRRVLFEFDISIHQYAHGGHAGTSERSPTHFPDALSYDMLQRRRAAQPRASAQPCASVQLAARCKQGHGVGMRWAELAQLSWYTLPAT